MSETRSYSEGVLDGRAQQYAEGKKDHDRLIAAEAVLWREYRALKADNERLRDAIDSTRAAEYAAKMRAGSIWLRDFDGADAARFLSLVAAAAVVALGREGTDGE